jgi:hypothetical protein
MFYSLRAWRDSNPRPSEPESDALSTELHALSDFDYLPFRTLALPHFESIADFDRNQGLAACSFTLQVALGSSLLDSSLSLGQYDIRYRRRSRRCPSSLLISKKASWRKYG